VHEGVACSARLGGESGGSIAPAVPAEGILSPRQDPLPKAGFHAEGYHRLRVGSYRVVYTVEAHLITVSRVDRAGASRLAVPVRPGTCASNGLRGRSQSRSQRRPITELMPESRFSSASSAGDRRARHAFARCSRAASPGPGDGEVEVPAHRAGPGRYPPERRGDGRRHLLAAAAAGRPPNPSIVYLQR
jgi:hypothetical protein